MDRARKWFRTFRSEERRVGKECRSRFLLVVLLPILGIVLSAFKTTTEVIQGPFALPETWRVDNFVNAWNAGRFSSYFRSSVIVVIPVVVVSVILPSCSSAS